jgi:phosphoribosylamine--glycine ligase
MKVFLPGNMARDAVIAERLAQEGCEMHIASSIRNPSLIAAADTSEGQFYPVSDVRNPHEIAEVAVASQADLFWLNQDDALAGGVVDKVAERMPEMLVASPNQESSRIEWDKFDSRRIVREIDDEQGTAYNPHYFCATEPHEIGPIMRLFQDQMTEAVIKPRGLTGGKGVKVMGPHLADYAAASQYAAEVLRDPRQGGVVIEEKLEGHEFTIQGLTDGKTLIAPPVTYDYPYREDDDTGPGTGGMGSFTMPPGEQLPFLTDSDYLEAIQLMRGVLGKQAELGRDFRGVLYGSFFKTPEGLKVVEFNARMGDPEALNIVESLAEETTLTNILYRIASKELSEQDARFKRVASTAIYLVSPDYAYRNGESQEFDLDLDKIAASGCRAYFSAAERIGLNRYRMTGASRTVALTSRARTPWDARAKINEAIAAGVTGPLQYRQDIGDHDYIRIELSR